MTSAHGCNGYRLPQSAFSFYKVSNLCPDYIRTESLDLLKSKLRVVWNLVSFLALSFRRKPLGGFQVKRFFDNLCTWLPRPYCSVLQKQQQNIFRWQELWLHHLKLERLNDRSRARHCRKSKPNFYCDGLSVLLYIYLGRVDIAFMQNYFSSRVLFFHGLWNGSEVY